ncbi:MAG TPA: transposase [Vicinamibacterales bacterium]|nr:transposase [Vicinamibacterales bacterium]
MAVTSGDGGTPCRRLAQAPRRFFSSARTSKPSSAATFEKRVALAEELAAALGSEPHERTDRRRGYRNGSIGRTITTPEETRTVTVPRGRIAGTDGATEEFRSQLLPRYARRTREIDEAILGCFSAA